MPLKHRSAAWQPSLEGWLSIGISAVFLAAGAFAAPPTDQPLLSSVGQPDDLIAVLGEDRARIWGHPARVLATADEKRLFLTESIGHVSAFDADTLKRVEQFRPHAKRCLDIALLDSDKRLVSISIDGTARLWDVTVSPPTELDRFEAFDASENAAWLSMSVGGIGKRIVLRSEEKLTVIDLKDDKLQRVMDLPHRTDSTPFQFCISQDGRWLLVCENQKTSTHIATESENYSYRDAILVVWDLSGKTPQVASELNRKTVDKLTVSPDGRTVVAADPYFLPVRHTHTWTLQKGRLTSETTLEAAQTSFTGTAFDSSGTRMVFASADGMVQIYRKSEQIWHPEAKLKIGNSAACTFLGSSIIAAQSSEIQRWDLVDGTYTKRPGPTGHSAPVMGLLFDAQTNTLLSAGKDAIREWSLSDYSEQPFETDKVDFRSVGEMWPWGDQKGFLVRRTLDGANIIEGIRRSGKKMLPRFRIDFGSNYRDAAWCAAMHPTKDILVTGHWDRKIRLWNTRPFNPKKLAEWDAHKGHVCDIAFSPDGNRIASVGFDNMTYVWNVESFEEDTVPNREEMGTHKDIVRSVAWSSDGRWLASGGSDGQILLWDMEKDKGAVSLLQPEDGPVKKDNYDSKTIGTLQFSSDGSRLLSGDAKGRVTVWSTRDHSIQRRWMLSGWIWDAKFSPDETMIATANYDGTVYLLKCPGGTE